MTAPSSTAKITKFYLLLLINISPAPSLELSLKVPDIFVILALKKHADLVGYDKELVL